MEQELTKAGVMLVAFWGLLKWTISRELKNIYSAMTLQFENMSKNFEKLEKQGDGHSKDLREIHGRVSVLEALNGQEPTLGRRKTDVCPSPECPLEPVRPAHRG